MAIRDEFRCRSLTLSYSSPHRFVRSQWNLSQGLFIAWRAFWFLWHLGWLIRSIQHEVSNEDYKGEGLKWFIYLTNWAYTVLFFQSGVHLIVVAYYTHKKKTKEEDFKDEQTGWLMKILWLLSNIGFDAAIIVTILYWALVFKELKIALSVMTHAVNSLYVILDIFLVACPVRLLHLVYSCGFATVFIAFSVFYHLGDGTNSDSDPYIYSALDWSDPGPTAGLAIGVVFVAVPLVHLFQFALYTLRLHMAETCCASKDESPGRGNIEESKRGEDDAEMGRNTTERY
ncbi:protein rolling stone-like [Plakobranchus ocellatus]|uniref:Protein rolling stone-like n=1 Tax=Plakobranchus ocellatus TaxID=259542 RepID=A0AAV4DIH4_9GAST|nr:protein rolling stone-like [Plakobranchus ocellatus]